MIEHYLQVANDFIASHPYYGLIFAFFIALAESLPLLGTIIPGSITMTMIGILVGRNLMPLGFTLLLGFLGAIIGDMFGYWIGIHYKERLHVIWPFRKYPKLLQMGQSFFEKHGGKSIIIGRFIGPTRSSVPLIAGLLKMRWPNFIIAAIPSAFLWAFAYLLPGVLIGAISLALPKEKATTFTLISLALIVFLWLIFWAIQRFFLYIAQTVNRLVDQCWYWLSHHHSSKFIIRLISSKDNPQDHHQLNLFFFAIISLLLFLFIFACVVFHFGLYHLNDPIFNFLQSLRSTRGNIFFVSFTELGNPTVATGAWFLITLFFTIRREWYLVFHLLALLLMVGGAAGIMKFFYYNPRPTGFIFADTSSSFPSGHVTFSMCLYGFFAYLTAYCLPKQFRWIPYTLASIVIFCISLSRLYIGAHWFCDVLGALSLGFGILLIVLISFRRYHIVIKESRFLLLIIPLAIIFSWSLIMAKDFNRDMYRYKPNFTYQHIYMNQWWEFPGIFLPIYRLDRLGNPIQPFNLEWTDFLYKIKTNLQQKGWIEIKSKKTLQIALQRFTSKNPEQHLAFLSPLYRQQPPVLFMIKHLVHEKTIIELRLWKTGINFIENGLPLYVGSINYHTAATSYVNLKPSLQITMQNGGGINELKNDIRNNYEFKDFIIIQPNVPKKIRNLQWNQDILMIRPKHKTSN